MILEIRKAYAQHGAGRSRIRNSGSGNVDIPLPFLLGICPNNEKEGGCRTNFLVRQPLCTEVIIVQRTKYVTPLFFITFCKNHIIADN